MTQKTKRWLVLFAVFGLGLGLGTAGGYVLNDITSREDPNAIQQIRQELEQQQQLDDFFTQEQAERPQPGTPSGEAAGSSSSGAPP